MINYHELTMEESRDSPARRKQYLVICTVMASFFLHSLLTSGFLSSLDIVESTFPGGEFIYKFVVKDYATANGVLDGISTDDLKRKRSAPMEDLFYSLFLDNSGGTVGASRQRFAAGMLNGSEEHKETLLSKNAKAKGSLTPEEQEEISFTEYSKKHIKYEIASLPKNVKAYACNFQFTNGFVSNLISTYKVIPAMMKYAESQGYTSPVVISTCSASQSVCTHYVPIEDTEKFLLGRPDSQTYQTTFDTKENKLLDWGKVFRGSKKFLKRMPPFSFFMGDSSSSKKTTTASKESSKEEL
mmetsp:Transcript_26591/g.37452  ORF Transcript_26591/g.37452 Transcript_26591/m.37452 type:complete len:299 (-) Transcript_26591:240-1136(-)